MKTPILANRMIRRTIFCSAALCLARPLCAESFPLTPAEATNPLVVDVTEEITWTTWLETQGGGQSFPGMMRSSSAAWARSSSMPRWRRSTARS